MADHVRISPQTAQLQAHGTAAPQQAARNGAPSGYGIGGARPGAVAPTQPMESDEIRRAAARLNRTLDAGEPLRTNVPRGFYLNIRV